MTRPQVHQSEPDEHDSAYAALHEEDDDFTPVDDSHWAFGTDFEDPLAGVDTTLPADVDGADLAAYCLMLGDDALVAAQRLTEWTGNAPDLEVDVALSNLALDLLGQARLLLARAAAADPGVVPQLPEGSPVPAEDALAFFREAHQLRNVRLVEQPRGDFADAVVGLLLHSTVRLAVLLRLGGSRDPVLAAIGAKGGRELAYHRDFAARWFVVLAQGTEESRARLEAAVRRAWALLSETTEAHPVIERLAGCEVAPDSAEVTVEVDEVLDRVLAAAGIDRPEVAPLAAVGGRKGRDGMHTEALSVMLAEMQSVARSHPLGSW